MIGVKAKQSTQVTSFNQMAPPQSNQLDSLNYQQIVRHPSLPTQVHPSIGFPGGGPPQQLLNPLLQTPQQHAETMFQPQQNMIRPVQPSLPPHQQPSLLPSPIGHLHHSNMHPSQLHVNQNSQYQFHRPKEQSFRYQQPNNMRMQMSHQEGFRQPHPYRNQAPQNRFNAPMTSQNGNNISSPTIQENPKGNSDQLVKTEDANKQIKSDTGEQTGN